MVGRADCCSGRCLFDGILDLMKSILGEKKKYKEDFCFYEKQRTVKIAVSLGFAASCHRTSTL